MTIITFSMEDPVSDSGIYQPDQKKRNSLSYISDKRIRAAAFAKRRKGLMKKVRHLLFLTF